MKHLARLVGVMMVAGMLLAQPALARQEPAAAAAKPDTAALTVQVTGPDAKPLANAAVSVAPLGLAGLTDQRGAWSAAGLAIAGDLPLEVTVSAKGHQDWIIRQPILRRNDTLILEADLALHDPSKQRGPQIIEVRHRQDSGQAQSPEPAGAAPAPNVAGTNTTPPSHIRVYRVALGRIDTVEFRDYVKHVLPNEWISSWPTESLRSGAMASKTYAWYRTMYAKYPGSGYDTKDTTADQVYNPNVAYASTNQAVDDTWDYKFTRNSAIFQTQYCAGSYNSSRTTGQCGENHGYGNFPLGSYMSQWGSKWYADSGYNWQSILSFYYDNIVVSTIGTGNPTPTTPPGGANCASYLGDVNYPDGSVVAPGSTITKRWRMQNCGTTNWSGYRAVQVSGSFGPASFAVSGAPGATVELAVSMVNHLTPGRYRTTYQLATSGGVRFGPTFWVEVVVQGGGATPTPTAPPQGTNCATFLGDVNYPDGTVVGRGSTIIKRWRMQNCGTANWSGYRAVQVSGSFGPSSFAVSGAPGATVELAVSMVNHLTPGRYRTTYQLATGAGVRFGPTFWVEVVVQ